MGGNKIHWGVFTLMATVTWIGFPGGGDGTSYSDPYNWNTTNVPVSGDVVIIGAGADVMAFEYIVFNRINLAGTLEISSDEASTESNINVLSGGILRFTSNSVFGGAGSIGVASGGVCEFSSGGYVADTATISISAGGVCNFNNGFNNSGSITTRGVCNFYNSGSNLSGSISILSGGSCAFGGTGVGANTAGVITVQSGGLLTWSTNGDNYVSGSVIVQSGGICNFFNSAVNNGSISFANGAVGAFNSLSSNRGAITVSTGGSCVFSGGLQRGNIFGSGVITFPTTTDLMRQLNGSSGRTGTATNTQRPTNFGGGQL